MSGRGPLTLPGGAAGLAFLHTNFSHDRDKSRPDIELVMGAGSLAGDALGILRSLLGKLIMFVHIGQKDSYMFNAHTITYTYFKLT